MKYQQFYRLFDDSARKQREIKANKNEKWLRQNFAETLLDMAPAKLKKAEQQFKQVADLEMKLDQAATHEEAVRLKQEAISSHREGHSFSSSAKLIEAEALVIQGDIQAAEGHRDHAFGYFNQAMATAPRYVPAIARCALVSMQIGKFELAKSLYEIASGIEPEKPRFATAIGVSLLELGQINEARKVFEMIVAKEETYPAAYFFLWHIHKNYTGNLGKADACFLEAEHYAELSERAHSDMERCTPDIIEAYKPESLQRPDSEQYPGFEQY